MEPANFKVPSTRGDTDLNCYRWGPEGPVRATLQISHGMVEHILRYSEFASRLASEGVAVYGHDHLGHGGTGRDDPGFFAEEDGDRFLIDDLFQVSRAAEVDHPGIPHLLLGHSMGSFVARRYLTRYGDHIDGVIISGTGNQPGYQVSFGRWVAGLLCRLKGPRSVSRFLNDTVLSRNDRYFDEPDLPNRWLSRDPSVVEAYNSDPMCQFMFTSAGYRDLFTMIRELERKVDFDRIPKDLAVIFMSGDQDPIGGFGKGVRAARDGLASAGLRPELKLYPGARHEILNETNREEVYEDILAWIGKVIS